MSIREITKYNKNFLTGDYYEQKVLKQDQASRNTATIQLINPDTGEVEQEAFTENAITPTLEGYGYERIASALFSQKMPSYMPPPIPTSIILSDTAIGEMEDLYFLHGEIIGACNKDDTAGAGPFKLRGTYNPAESYSRVEDGCIIHHHRVYDWSTSAGNGKIQAIYWSSKDQAWVTNSSLTVENAGKAYFTSNALTGTIRGSQNASTDIRFDRRGGAYLITASKYYKILNFLSVVNQCEPIKLDTKESYFSRHEVAGHYYTVKTTETGGGTIKYTLIATIEKRDTTGVIVDQWDLDMIAGIPQLEELRRQTKLGNSSNSANDSYVRFSTYCDFDGWIGIQYTLDSPSHASSSSYVFPNYNETTDTFTGTGFYTVTTYSFYNVLTKRWLYSASPWEKKSRRNSNSAATTFYPLRKLDNFNTCTNMNRMATVTILEDNVKLVNLSTGNETNGSSHSDGIYYIHASLPIGTGDSFFNLDPIFAHTRLASPIVKTSLNTMKIQYDFFFKMPLPYMPPDKIWALYDE